MGGAAANSSAHGHMRQLVSCLAALSGIALIVFTFAAASFLRTGDGERVLGRFKTATTTQGFAAFGAGYAETAAAANELTAKDYPVFAHDLGMTDAQFSAYVKSNLSAIDYGARTVKALPSLIDPVVSGVAALPDGKFQPVYDLPVKGVSLTAVPWLLIGLGLVLIAAAVAAARRRGSWAVAVVLVVAAGMVIVPFAISLPSKVSQTSRVIKVATVGLSAQAATRSEQAAYAADGLVRQFNGELLPALAKRQGVSTAQLRGELTTQAPALSKFIADWPVLAPQNFAFAAAIRESVGEFAEARRFPFSTVPWLVIALGGVLVLAAGATLLIARRDSASPA